MHIPYYRYLFLLLLMLVVVLPAHASYEVGNFSQGELDQLVAPIALYPDPLLAQLLPASTFTDQIQEAADYRNGRIDDQDWDISVRSIAHYPSVLSMMSTKIDWTTALGQAYIDQPDDIMDAIQRERQKAYDYGYLRSTSRQEVIVESGGYIRIEPADASYIYVPRYDPDVVFVRRARTSESTQNLISFGLGLLIGSWLNRDVDWDNHRVFYHGWNGEGWIGRSRSHVTINNIYVNNTYVNQPIRLNRTVTTRDITPYRNDLRKNTGKFSPPTKTILEPQHTYVPITPTSHGRVTSDNSTVFTSNVGKGPVVPKTKSTVTRGRNNRTTKSTGNTFKSTGGTANSNSSYKKGGSQNTTTVKSTSGRKTNGKGKTTTDKNGKDTGKNNQGN
jgi:hypothetical protein